MVKILFMGFKFEHYIIKLKELMQVKQSSNEPINYLVHG